MFFQAYKYSFSVQGEGLINPRHCCIDGTPLTAPLGLKRKISSRITNPALTVLLLDDGFTPDYGEKVGLCAVSVQSLCV